jgi:hypothetical protein
MTLNKIGERIVSCFSLQFVLNIQSFILKQFVLSGFFTFSVDIVLYAFFTIQLLCYYSYIFHHISLCVSIEIV